MINLKKMIAYMAASALISMSSTFVIAKDDYVMAGASPGGLWSLLGAGVDKAMRVRAQLQS